MQAEQLTAVTPYDLIISKLTLTAEKFQDLIACPGDCPMIVWGSGIDQSHLDQFNGQSNNRSIHALPESSSVSDVRAIAQNKLGSTAAPPNQTNDCDPLPGMIGNCDAMCEVYQRIRKVAPTKSTVLVRGETGTGKELIAKAIHDNSTRCKKPFIAINCAAIPETLIESELFGHEKGALSLIHI